MHNQGLHSINLQSYKPGAIHLTLTNEDLSQIRVGQEVCYIPIAFQPFGMYAVL